MEEQRNALIERFMAINAHTNLSAIRDPEGIRIKHIQDSLEINDTIKLKPGSTLCDVGTGGGFPLLPIAMTNPGIRCIGIDSTKKKIEAIKEMIAALHITNVDALRTRAEDHHQTYDYVTARAVGYIDKLLPQIRHLVKPGGQLILYKQYTPEEAKAIDKIAKRYHFTIKKKHAYKLIEGDIPRMIYILKKNKDIAFS